MEKDEEGKMIIMKFHSWVATHNTAHSIPLAVCLVDLLHFFKHSRKTKDVEQKTVPTNDNNSNKSSHKERSGTLNRHKEMREANDDDDD